MKRGGGKAKGSAFEREIGRKLSLWLTGGADATQLIRSVLSGGWSKGHRAPSGFRQVGDLAPNGPQGEAFRAKFAVECKHRRSIDLYGLWTKADDSDDLKGWWNKLCADSANAAVTPMLIWRQNGRPILVGLPEQCMPDVDGIVIAGLGDNIFALAMAPLTEILKCDPAAVMRQADEAYGV